MAARKKVPARAPRKKAETPAAVPLPGTHANEARGETEITLEGVRYAMRPSHEAIDEFEQATDKSTKQLFDLAAADRLKARDLAAIVTSCIRAKGRQDGDQAVAAFNVDRVRQILVGEDGGLLIATRSIAILLLNAVSGGVTSEGKLKPSATKSPSTAA